MQTNKKIRWLGMWLIIILLGISMLFGCAKPVPAPSPAKPPIKIISAATYEIGISSYVTTALFGEACLEKFGVKVRLIPMTTDIARTIPTRVGDTDCSVVASSNVWSQEGLFEFATRDWGPQAVRGLWQGRNVGTAPVAAGDSDIYSLADLKGKRVAWIVGAMASNNTMGAYLAFGGLSWDDVEIVLVPGLKAGMAGVIEGDIDCCTCTITSSPTYELEAKRGIHVLAVPDPEEAPEAWEAALKINPLYAPRKCILGPSLSEENWVLGVSTAYPTFLAYDFLDEDKAYFWTKAINECYDIYEPKNKMFKVTWGLDNFLYMFKGRGGRIPLHKGTVRYFKEIGVWSDELEALNQERLLHQRELKELWDITVREAEEQKVKGKEFTAFWLEKRTEKFGPMGLDSEDVKRWEKGG